jgi:L-rhamnonate dehydratase
MGFIGGKMPLHHGPAEGEQGLGNNLNELEVLRNAWAQASGRCSIVG